MPFRRINHPLANSLAATSYDFPVAASVDSICYFQDLGVVSRSVISPGPRESLHAVEFICEIFDIPSLSLGKATQFISDPFSM